MLIDLRSFISLSLTLSRTLFYKNYFEQSSTDSQSVENSSFTFFKISSFFNLCLDSSLSEFINLCFSWPLLESINLRIGALINVHDQEYQLRF